MSGKVSIDVYTLSGINQLYEIDIGTTISEFIKMIIQTHKAYIDKRKFDIARVDWHGTRLIHNGKSLEHLKTFEEYTEFQYKSKGPYKLHIVPRGGSVGEDMNKLADDFDNFDPKKITRPSSPITIKSSNVSISNSGTRLSYERPVVSQSYPGTNSFLESQINRLDRRQRSDSLKQVSESLSNISNYLKDLSISETSESSDKLEKIIQMLSSIDGKLTRLIDMGTPTN